MGGLKELKYWLGLPGAQKREMIKIRKETGLSITHQIRLKLNGYKLEKTDC
jgi:hypothetical protein